MPKNNHYTLSFEDAKKIVHSYGFKTSGQWEIFAKSDKRPKNIPKSPQKVYVGQWKGIADWLGNGKVKQEQPKKTKGHRYNFLPYQDAKAYVQKLQIKSNAQYRLWSKTERPNNIPAHADEIYRNEFEGWAEYLGYNAVQPQQMPDLFVEVQQQPEQPIEIEEATNAPEQIEQAPIEKPQSSDLGKFVQAYQLMAEAHSQLLGLFAEMIEGNRAK